MMHTQAVLSVPKLTGWGLLLLALTSFAHAAPVVRYDTPGFEDSTFTTYGEARARGAIGPADPLPGYNSSSQGSASTRASTHNTTTGASTTSTNRTTTRHNANDEDGDGVLNSQDRCLGDRPGARVDSDGCELPDTIVLYFPQDSADIPEVSANGLNGVAANLNRYGFTQLWLRGYTDTVSERGRTDLALRRAQTIRDYLQAKGIALQRLNIMAAAQAEAGDLARQRKVEMVIEY